MSHSCLSGPVISPESDLGLRMIATHVLEPLGLICNGDSMALVVLLFGGLVITPKRPKEIGGFRALNLRTNFVGAISASA